eukprot:2680756-Rhodomonas_salina.2
MYAPTRISYNRPLLSSVFAEHETATGGFEIALFGVGFGERNATDQSSTVRVGASSCEESRWASDSSLVCRVASVLFPFFTA